MIGIGRVWQKPELVVLSRSTAEEKVLTACKTLMAGGTSEAGVNTSCYWGVDCQSCSSEAAS